MISEIPLSDYGLMTVDEAAASRGWVVRAVQKWITDGLLPVVCAGKGKRGVNLLREADIKAFTPPRGRPPKTVPIPARKRSGKRL